MHPSASSPHPVDAHASHHGHGPVVWVRNKFLAGLALALPLVVTFWILQVVYGLLHGWSEPLLRFFADLTNELAGREIVSMSDPNVQLVTRFVGVVIPIAVLVGLGVMATNVIGVRVVSAMDRLLLSIPIISFIYKSLKQVIEAFKGLGGSQGFKRVAYIDYPVPGMRMIGFVTGQFTDAQSGKAQTAVFLPTAPNPMTGILLVVDSEKVTDAPLTLEEATKLIFSGGLVAPTSTATPLNRPASAVSDAGSNVQSVEVSLPVADPELEEIEPALPAGLPRAEDFDSGDPDILSDVDEAVLHGARGSRWKAVLPWKKRRR